VLFEIAMMKHHNTELKISLGWQLLSTACLMVAFSPASAQDYPSRPIRFIAPTSPGGANDVLARILGVRMTENWKQQVVVDVRPGAGGIVGTELAARAAPDGYTILIVANGYALNPFLHAKLPYDTMKDFERVTLFASASLVLVVHAAVAAQSVPELIAMAKAKPNSLNYGSSGSGSAGWLSMELFRSMTRSDMTHVPYKGAGQASAAIVAGEVQMLVTALPVALPFIKAGRLRALGVTSTRRASQLPQVAAISDTLPGYEVLNVFGILAPARTPTAIINKLHQEVRRVTALAPVKNQLDAIGFDVENRGPADFTAYVQAEMTKWGKIFAERGIKPE
jgi:tripartite-type tricarboxylate transporter receptor subunit TctC